MLLNRPSIEIIVYELGKKDKQKFWNIFASHHYLTTKLNKAARCFVGYWEEKPVAFNSILTMPSPTMKNAVREHRLVVLPDFQGMGIGIGMSEFCGEIMLNKGKRYFSKTANIKLGEHRNNSNLWKPTSKNNINRKDNIKSFTDNPSYNNILSINLQKRICYSHEYIGG